MVHDPALFVLAIVLAVYAPVCLTCWAFDIKHTRGWPVLLVGLSSGVFAVFFLTFGVRW